MSPAWEPWSPGQATCGSATARRSGGAAGCGSEGGAIDRSDGVSDTVGLLGVAEVDVKMAGDLALPRALLGGRRWRLACHGRDRCWPWPGMGGRCSSIVNRVVRSTRVPIVELCSPRIRSPSQWPGTARSSASAGRWVIMIWGLTNLLPRCWVRALGTRSARPVRRTSHEFAFERSSTLHVERLVDGFVRYSHGLIMGEIDPEPVRDLLGAPRACPASILSWPVTATDPAHLGSWHELAIGAGDNATKAILNIPAKLVVLSELRDLLDGWRVDPNATARSWPGTQGLRYGLRRCGAVHVRSSTVIGPAGGRSHAPHSYGRGEQRSLLAQQRTNNVPKPGQKKKGPSRHSRGTNANQPQATHQPPHRHPRSTTHQRSLPKTAPDAHGARPADDQATASQAATHDQPDEPSLLPS